MTLDCDISEREARLLEAYGPLEMARIIDILSQELAWIEAFAQIRSKDDSKTFARVNRGALRNIAERAGQAFERVKSAWPTVSL
jgi:hypothetical protein